MSGISAVFYSIANFIGRRVGFTVTPNVDSSKLSKSGTSKPSGTPKVPEPTERIAALLQGLATKTGDEIQTCAKAIVPLLAKNGQFPANYFDVAGPNKQELAICLANLYKEAVDNGNAEEIAAFVAIPPTTLKISFPIDGVLFSPLAYSLIEGQWDSAKCLLLNGARFYDTDVFAGHDAEVEAMLKELYTQALEVDGDSALLTNIIIAAKERGFALEEIPFNEKTFPAIAAEIETFPYKMKNPEYEEKVKKHKDILLYHAVKGGHLGAVRKLLELGADVFAKIDPKEDLTILDRALIDGRTGALVLFAEHVKADLLELESTKIERMFDAQLKPGNHYNSQFTLALLNRGLDAFHKVKYEGNDSNVRALCDKDGSVSVCDIVYANDDSSTWIAIVEKGYGIGRIKDESRRKDCVSTHLEKFITFTVQLVKDPAQLNTCFNSLRQYAVVVHWFRADENIFDKTFAAWVANPSRWGDGRLKGLIKQEGLTGFVVYLIESITKAGDGTVRCPAPMPAHLLARNILKTFTVKDGVWPDYIEKLYPVFECGVLLDVSEEQFVDISHLFLPSRNRAALMNSIRNWDAALLNEHNPEERERIIYGMMRLFGYMRKKKDDKTKSIFEKLSPAEQSEIETIEKKLDRKIKNYNTIRQKKEDREAAKKQEAGKKDDAASSKQAPVKKSSPATAAAGAGAGKSVKPRLPSHRRKAKS